MLLLAGVGFAAVAALVFVISARTAQPDFRPITEPLPAELVEKIDRIPDYRRSEDATYLTFVEWYLVFNPQEYAQFIAEHRASAFPYFGGIGQIWSGYREVYGITRRHYGFNTGYHLMLAVIAGSSTVEFGLKGAYEKTIGRLFEWSADGEPTAEDHFAAAVAREYGEFIPTQPWFEFPFGRKLRSLWTETDFFGPHLLRKCERKVFLSVEYGVKALYASVIRLGSRSVYGVAETEVYLSARNVSEGALARADVRAVEQIAADRWILAVPHYQGFTDLVPVLAADGVDFEEVAGNDEILVSFIIPRGGQYDLSAGQPLFEMPLLVGDSQRVAVQVPVKTLGAVLREAAAKRLRVEHIFDY